MLRDLLSEANDSGILIPDEEVHVLLDIEQQMRGIHHADDENYRRALAQRDWWQLATIPSTKRRDEELSRELPRISEDNFLVELEEIKLVHIERRQIIQDLLQGFIILDGGIKSPDRIKAKTGKTALVDLTRLQVVTDGLYDLQNAFITLIRGIRLEIARISNYYHNDTVNLHGTPWRGVNVALFDTQHPNWMTQVQIVSKRVRAVGILNHPFDLSSRLKYPSDEHIVFMNQMLKGATTLDYRDALEV